MKLLIIFLLLAQSIFVLAHGDHATPGAIPPAPHGGALQEAKHKHNHAKHDHKEASKREIFFEAKLDGKELKIYPLEIEPKESKTFLPIKTDDFTNVKIVVMDARKNKEIESKWYREKDYWPADFSNMKGRRFKIHISADLSGALFKATMQIEKK